MDRKRQQAAGRFEFEEMHIKWVWTELQEHFGFNVPEWKKRYFEEWNKNRTQDETGFFLVYMNKNINPILNQILCRHNSHPTFNKFAEYVVKRGRV